MRSRHKDRLRLKWYSATRMIKRNQINTSGVSDMVNRGSKSRVDYSSSRVTRNREDFRSFSAPLKIEAIVTVCTEALIHELREWLPTARRCYPGIPLYVATDVTEDRVMEYARDVHVENVHVVPLDLAHAVGRVGKVNVWAKHWILEAIWCKLDALRRVVEKHPRGVLLADCDITFIRPTYRREYWADVVLSPNFHGDLQLTTPDLSKESRIPLFVRDSLFNAGMVATRSVEFCEWWIEQYEAGGEGTFVEQTALEQVPRLFDVDYFGPEENFGKWRFAAPPPNTNSVHMHVHERARKPEVTILKIAAQSSAASARKFLRGNPTRRK